MGQDPVAADPNHNRVVFENDQIRVILVSYAPGEKSAILDRKYGIGVALTDRTARLTPERGAAQSGNARAGEFQLVEGKLASENTGSRAFETLIVEYKTAEAKQAAMASLSPNGQGQGQSARTTTEANEASAVGVLRTLNTAEITFASTYNQGFTDGLNRMGEPPAHQQPTVDHADLLAPWLAGLADGGSNLAAIHNGYRFTYTPGTGAFGNIPTYTVVAEPLNYGLTGTRSYYTDQLAVIRHTDANRPANAGDPDIGSAQAAAPRNAERLDAVQADPSHHAVAYENDKIRVLLATLSSGDKTPALDYGTVLSFSLNDHKERQIPEKGAARDVASTAGEVMPIGGRYVIENTGSEVSQSMLVEFKTPEAARMAGSSLQNLTRPPTSREKANEASATATLRTYNTAEVVFASTYNKGFTDGLNKLATPAGGGQPDMYHADLVDPVLSGLSEGGTNLTMIKNGYKFTYTPGPGQFGLIISYTITAEPVEYGVTGKRSFYTDQSAVVRATTDNRPANAGDNPL